MIACPQITGRDRAARVCVGAGGTATHYIAANGTRRRGAAVMNTRKLTLSLVVAAALAAGAALWFVQHSSPPAAPPVAAAPPAPAEPPRTAASESHYPVESAAAAPLGREGIAAALEQVLGRATVSSFFVTDDLPRRFAATVDNLGRSHAPALLWPVTPTAGRFTVQDSGAATVIADANAARYAPFVRMVEAVDLGRAVELYRRMYPLLQNAYQELGYPKGYFNDRVVKVIDLLLATPQPEGPLQVHLLEVKGSVASTRPWVRYEFADPQLESLSAGQKILLRVGPDHERRLKAKLTQLRTALTQAPARPQSR